MKYLAWGIRLLCFGLLLFFALQNTDPVALSFFGDQVWRAPLVVVLLAFLGGGFVLGLLALVGTVFRQRGEIHRLRRQLSSVAVERQTHD